MSREIQFYGLLYLAGGQESFANLPKNLGRDIYVACAVNCARSFARQGHDYTLLTNAADEVVKRARALGLSPPKLASLTFSREVPAELGFASAHRKLEVMSALGSGDWGERCALVDLDTELVRPLHDLLPDENRTIVALSLAREMEMEFGCRVAATLTRIAGAPLARPRWWGGEFLCADASGFAALDQLVREMWERYLAQAAGSIHEGDEAVTSAALSLLDERGWAIRDAGASEVVARWWSARTAVPMPRFAEIQRAALFHLPADKPFLAARAGHDTDPKAFAADYRAALRGKLLARRAATVLDGLRGRTPPRYPPRW